MRLAFILLFLVSTAFAEDTATTTTTSKLSAPTEAALKPSREIIEEVFGESIRTARTIDEKLKLAAKIFGVAEKSKDPLEQYALLKQSQELALDAKDLMLYLRTIDILTKKFQVDKVALRVNMLTKLVGKKSDEETLRKLAEIDAAAIEDSSKSPAAAESWYELGKSLQGSISLSVKERAISHYQAALPHLTGLDKLQAEKRIQELQADIQTIPRQKKLRSRNDLKTLIGMWAVINKKNNRTIWTFYKDGSVRCGRWNPSATGIWAFEPRSVKIVWNKSGQKWNRLPRPLDPKKTIGDDWEIGPETIAATKLDLSKLKIIKATYQAGSKKADVTKKFSKTIYDKGCIHVDDGQMGADPAVGWRKHLVVTYSVDGKKRTVTFNQFQTAIIDENLDLKAY